ncbi:MAG TPA: hypothetical protein PLX69_25260 [Leptospiraceae bacterium]|nr:hypothetical protein [Leptospiraceae bacterium]
MLYPFSKVNSELKLDTLLLKLGNYPFVEKSGTYLREVVFKLLICEIEGDRIVDTVS